MAALQKLIEINGKYSEAINGNVIDLKKLKQITDEVTSSIRLQAQAQAASSLSAERQKEVFQVTAVRQKLETEFIRGAGKVGESGVRSIPFSKEDREILSSLGASTKDFTITTGGNIEFNERNYNRVKAFLIVKENQLIEVFDQYSKVQSELQAKLLNIEASAQTAASNALKKKSTSEALTQPELEALIEGINKQIRTLKEGDPLIRKLQADRDAFQKRLDALLGKEIKVGRPTRDSRLTGEQKDDIKEIEAEQNEQLARWKRL